MELGLFNIVFFLVCGYGAVYGEDSSNNARTFHVSSGHTSSGQTYKIEQLPYQVAVLKGKKHQCSGSIISDYFVLTAAHCVAKQSRTFYHYPQSPHYHIMYAATKLYKGIAVKVREIYRHPQFYSKVNDIAILQLGKPIMFSRYASPVVLGMNAEENDIGLISGYDISKGILHRNYASWEQKLLLPYKYGIYPSSANYTTMEESEHKMERTWPQPKKLILRGTNVTVISKQLCSKKYHNLRGIVDGSVFCAVGKKNPSCYAGGPLVKEKVQIGLFSFGAFCNHPQFPGIYVKMGKYRSFIDSITDGKAKWDETSSTESVPTETDTLVSSTESLEVSSAEPTKTTDNIESTISTTETTSSFSTSTAATTADSSSTAIPTSTSTSVPTADSTASPTTGTTNATDASVCFEVWPKKKATKKGTRKRPPQ